MFVQQKEIGVVTRTLVIIMTCVSACFALYDFALHYYNMLQIGITKAPMFFIGMLVAWYSCLGLNMTLKHIIGGGKFVKYYLLAKKSI